MKSTLLCSSARKASGEPLAPHGLTCQTSAEDTIRPNQENNVLNVAKHFRSITNELDSLKDRVRNFIANQHWLTDGEWKESVLRTLIAQRLPDTVRIGRGFVLTEQGPTTQCDIILYRADCPVLFRDADLVFLTPDAVLSVIEVKSRVTRDIFQEAISKLASIGLQLGRHADHCCLALFAYETASDPREWYKEILPAQCRHSSQVVDLVNLGCSSFVRWWKYSPFGGDAHYENWHSYRLENMSAGYFIANLIDKVSSGTVALNERFWYPERSKENDVIDRIPFGPSALAPSRRRRRSAQGPAA